jgi:hypothetical protein
LYVLQCDDGNTIDGDGCSSTCTIEPNFTCIDGSTTHPSVCSYSGILQLTLTSTTKTPNANQLVFTLSVNPPLMSLASLSSFNNIIQTSLKNSGINATYSNGLLTVVVNYTETAQSKVCSISFVPPENSTTLFAVQLSSVEFTIIPTNN